MHLLTSQMSVSKLVSISQGIKSLDEQDESMKDKDDVCIIENDPIEVISLDGDDNETNDIIEEEDVEEISNNSDKNNTENDPDVVEVISLVDEESSSDENEDIPIGTAKLSFLDAENKKIHRFIKIRNAEDEKVLVDVVGVSSDSDVEEVIEKDNDTSIYITIDPDDYKKVLKEKVESECNKKLKMRRKAKLGGYTKTKGNKSNDFPVSSNVEGAQVLDGSVNDSQHYESPVSEEDNDNVSEKDNDKSIYITIDADDYKKVIKENVDFECNKKLKMRSKTNLGDYTKAKVDKSNDFPISSHLKDSLKGPNIPKAICCQSCSFVCFKEDDLAVHTALKHPSKTETIRTYTAAEIQELEREMKDQAADCSSCGQALWYLPTLRAHALIHSTGQFCCEACHHGTSVIKLLMEHLESHVGSEEEEDSDL